MDARVRKPADQVLILLDCQRRVLERIASGAPLADVLLTLVRLIEQFAPDLRCAVLLADVAQQRLRFVAAPSIPEEFRARMEPYLRIAPGSGSCGTAALLRQPVYARDLATDPVWSNFGRIAVRYGVRATWSTPILSDANAVLGIFTMYYGTPRLPTEEHVQLIDMAVQLARVAIEASLDDEVLEMVFEDAAEGILVTDLAGYIVRANPAFVRMLGYAPGELDRRSVADVTQGEDHAALVEELMAAGPKGISSDRRYRGRSGVVLWARAHSALRRDAAGEPRYVLTHVSTLTAAESDPLERLSRREREALELVVEGASSKAIAARLAISPSTVDTYRSRIMAKLDLKDLPSLVRFAIRHGIASA